MSLGIYSDYKPRTTEEWDSTQIWLIQNLGTRKCLLKGGQTHNEFHSID